MKTPRIHAWALRASLALHAFCATALTLPCWAADTVGVVSTTAGVAQVKGYWNVALAQALLAFPAGVATDPDGSVVVSDFGNHVLRKVTSGGQVSTLAGYPETFGATDAKGLSARFAGPAGIAMDSAANVYVADMYNHSIRVMDSAGNVRTLAGKADHPGSADGAGEAARFNLPCAVAVDSRGFVFVADSGNHTIRKISAQGLVTTLAGSAGVPGHFDGGGADALFNTPSGIASDAQGNLLVADTANHVIRKITAEGRVSTFAGRRGVSGFQDGSVAEASFNAPEGVAISSSGYVYVADTGNCVLRLIHPDMHVSSLAGEPEALGADDGTGSKARFFSPTGIAVDSNETLYVADRGNHTLRKVSFPPVVLSGPTARTLTAGDNLSLEVSAFGSRPLLYQWRKGGNLLAGADAPLLFKANASAPDAGDYSVHLSNSVGNVSSGTVRVQFIEVHPVTILSQPNRTYFLPNSEELTVRIEDSLLASEPVSYEVLSFNAPAAAPVSGAGGTVPASGILTIAKTLNLPSGDYFVRFTRGYAGGHFTRAETHPFRVGRTPLDTLAGTYETLLWDESHAQGQPGPVDDAAQYRGWLGFTVSKTGLVTGRLQYVTAQKNTGGNLRAYAPLTRPFIGRLKAAMESPARLECTIPLGGGNSAGKATLFVSANFENGLPVFVARIEERLSTVSAGNTSPAQSLTSRSLELVRTLNRLPLTCQGAAGRYAMYAEDPNTQAYAALFVYVLPAGRILWTSRHGGVAGSGSASPFLNALGSLSFCLFEGRAQISSARLHSRFLLGQLRLAEGGDGLWRAQAENGALEEQSAALSKNAAETSDRAEVAHLAFHAGTTQKWMPPTPAALRTLITSGQAQRLTLIQSVAGSPAVTTRSWDISMPHAGQLRAVGVPSAEGLPPALRLGLDRNKGEWTGTYTGADGTRFSLFGVALPTETNAGFLLQGEGWSEGGTLPTLRAGSWTLHPLP